MLAPGQTRKTRLARGVPRRLPGLCRTVRRAAVAPAPQGLYWGAAHPATVAWSHHRIFYRCDQVIQGSREWCDVVPACTPVTIAPTSLAARTVCILCPLYLVYAVELDCTRTLDLSPMRGWGTIPPSGRSCLPVRPGVADTRNDTVCPGGSLEDLLKIV